ncbi:30S ribosomal protein S9 [Candidatus Bipolaricaulota bacterium]|nr:30S ribosomal protein S9 [Candidatus Bipolaricaulota bacterium]
MEEQPRRLPKRIDNMVHTIGRRKESTARVYLSEGDGKISVNGRAANDYFSSHIYTDEYLEKTLKRPFHVTETVGRFNVKARINGGGFTGQLDALKLGIARALVGVSAEYRPVLKQAGLLTRDARAVERKKYGRRKARKSEQYSKR